MEIHLGQYWRLLRLYLRPLWPRAVALAVLLCAAIALELLSPQLLRGFIDRARAGASARVLIGTAALFMLVALGGGGVTVVETYVAESLGWTATNRLRADLALHLLRLDLSFHHAHTPGELIERLDGDVTALANFFSRFVIYVVGNVVLLAGVVLLLGREDARIGLETAVFAVAILVAMARLYGVARPVWAALDEANARFYGFLGERIGATEDIRSCGATAYTLLRLYEQLRALRPLQIKATFLGQLVWVAALNLSALATAGALALGTLLVDRHAATVGTVYLVFLYTDLLVRPIAQLQAQIQDLQQAGAAVGRINDLFATRSRLPDPEGPGAPISSGPLTVALDAVSFRYDADSVGEPALCDVTLCLEQGAVLGLLGRTGSGKTTLVRLLARLGDPSAGTVRLGGTDLRAARLAEVRRRVGFVTQEVQLFAASVRDNLTFFDPHIPDTALLGAIAELGLDEWYRRLPDGLDTLLGPGGMGMSAGEAQLLAFVRVTLRDPGLVILDEASAHLDPATERLVDHAVGRLLRGRTAVIIAHRLTTVERADRIVTLDAGRVVEDGPRAALARDPASYYSRALRAGLQEVLQ